ncbi:hypothetical protein SAMN04488009_2207 [Maribacter sedimenticola]|uniref:Uncharacterized protein n=2 Tax=Maribacter sedimenticola TaxID=228956 RepID=A0ABY1SHE5_9FLAO|nr:hypothetical protein SAMN04488009_2207 [Maribacter sedimenticola]
MRNMLHKFFSVAMALLLLLSTISWTVEKHLCMGRVLDIAFFHSAEDCGMEAGLALLDDASQYEKHCCDDESFTMQGQDDLNHDTFNLDFSQQVFLISFTTSYLNLFQESTDKKIVLDSYPPPILAEDLNILHQVFLI